MKIELLSVRAARRNRYSQRGALIRYPVTCSVERVRGEKRRGGERGRERETETERQRQRDREGRAMATRTI